MPCSISSWTTDATEGLPTWLAIVISMAISLTGTPMMCAYLLKTNQRHGRLYEKSERAFDAVIRAYGRTLEAKPWRKCGCDICRELGHHVILFRGAERNRRRGLHNVWVFYRRLRQEMGPAPATAPSAARRSARRLSAMPRLMVFRASPAGLKGAKAEPRNAGPSKPTPPSRTYVGMPVWALLQPRTRATTRPASGNRVILTWPGSH